MSVSVVGGSGFIGTRFCKRLQRTGIEFKIIDKRESKAFRNFCQIADVRSFTDLRSAIPDGSILVNLAAEHRDDVKPIELYGDVNVGGAEKLCAVATEKNINTIIFTSTVAVYGFAPVGTDETGAIRPFNEYGRTKYAAEQIFRRWQAENPVERTLVIVRPTVVFGEDNRGNVYNLLRQIALRKFLMIGSGENRKSMAYVENIAAFLEFSLRAKPGVHVFNYVDKPDFDMNRLVSRVRTILGLTGKIRIRIPYFVGYVIGRCFDAFSYVTGKRLVISSIRIKKFCSDSVFDSAISVTGFVPPVKLEAALENTVRHEFIDSQGDREVFYSE